MPGKKRKRVKQGGWKRIEKAIALIDGEHYLPVIKEALQEVEKEGRHQIVALVLVGGTEKITEQVNFNSLGFPVVTGDDASQALKEALGKYKPEAVIDLSDEPVLGYQERFMLASVALGFGVCYLGADFSFEPIVFEDVSEKPAISIIGTGKRVGKTAVTGYVARRLKEKGESPVVVAMGRGGPKKPEVLKGATASLDSHELLSLSKEGKHAASDYFEDALTSRVTTVGCSRCGGGLVGKPYVSNVLEGAYVANELDEKVVIFEGSGAAIPPVLTDSCLNVVSAHQPLAYIQSYFGPFRIGLCDVVVLTMCEEPLANQDKVSLMVEAIEEIKPEVKVIPTVFRPKPLGEIKDKKIFLTTTAPKETKDILKSYLEEEFGCQVIGISHNLANRKILHGEIEAEKNNFEVLLTELKAAAVDVSTGIALGLDKKVVYVDNIPVVLDKNLSLDEEIDKLLAKAKENFEKRRKN